MKRKALSINIIFNLANTVVNLLYSFFITPIVTEHVGTAAYGYISLANNFTSYMSIVTIAINSMAYRFIMVNYYKKKFDDSSKYFSSVVFANMFFSIAMTVPLFFFVLFLNNFIRIDANLVFDVKLLFGLIFINFLFSIITSIYNACFYITNKLYLDSLKNILGNILRVVLIFLLFFAIGYRVYIVGVGALISTAVYYLFSAFFKKKLTPEVKCKLSFFSGVYLKQLLILGVWDSITQLTLVLNDGLDLLLCNLFISSETMGMLSIAKAIPTIILTIATSLSNIFLPDLTKHYSADDQKGFKTTLDRGIKIIMFLLTILYAGFTVFGQDFFRLWLPTKDSELLYRLAIVSILGLYCTLATTPVLIVFVLTKKVKLNAFVSLGVSFTNVGLVFLLLRFSNLGVYAIAGVSSITTLLRYIFWTYPYASKCISEKWHYFYRYPLRNLLSLVISIVLCLGVKKFFDIHSWLSFLLCCSIAGTFLIISNLFTCFDKETRNGLFGKVFKRV